MTELKKQELMKIEGGGGSAFAIGCFIVGAIIFLIGVIDGYMRPLKCHS